MMIDLKVSDGIKRFLEHIAKRHKPNTHKFYQGRLVALGEQLGSKKCRRLKVTHFEKYFERVNHWPGGREKAPDTQRGNILAVEQLQKFLIKIEVIAKAIIEDIQKPVGRMRERIPTPEEVDQIKAKCSPAFCLIYEALRRCGARPNELARSTVGHWDRVNGMIVLQDHKTAKKTGQARMIAVGEKMEVLILESLGSRTEGHLFLSPRGRIWNTESLSSAFRRARNRAGVDRSIVLYTARHEHGTAVYHQHGELAAATALGHKGAGMIHRYAKISPMVRKTTQDSLAI